MAQDKIKPQYKIKQLPEDFIVKEIPVISLKKQGDYSYYSLKKKDYTTIKALQTAASTLKINIKQIGFAGTKDKRAITEQIISLKTGKTLPKKIKLKDLELVFLGKGETPISLGDLKGNFFEITIRNLDSIPEMPSKTRILNLFDEQRFSINNVEIGRSIIKKDFKRAVNSILENKEKYKGEYEADVENYLEKKPNDYVGALRLIPKKILLLFMHSFQSYLWNRTAVEMSKNLNLIKKMSGSSLEIVGFGTEFRNNETKKIIKKLLKEENITLRDFIIRQFPELSSEGNERPLFAEINDLNVIEKGQDELNPGKKKVKISFSLPKASYATMIIKNLFN